MFGDLFKENIKSIVNTVIENTKQTKEPELTPISENAQSLYEKHDLLQEISLYEFPYNKDTKKSQFNIVNELFDSEADLNAEIARVRKEIRDNEEKIKQLKEVLKTNPDLSEKGKSDVEQKIEDLQDEIDMLNKALIKHTKEKSAELKKESTNYISDTPFELTLESGLSKNIVKTIRGLKHVTHVGKDLINIETAFIKSNINTILLEFLNFFKSKEKKIKDRLAEIDDILETRNNVLKQTLEDIKEIQERIDDLENRKRLFEKREQEQKLKEKKAIVDKERDYMAELEQEQKKLLRQLKDLEDQQK